MMHTVWRHELNDLLQVVLDLLYTQGLPIYVTSYSVVRSIKAGRLASSLIQSLCL